MQRFETHERKNGKRMKQVEQITSKGVLVLDCDETLSNRELIDVIIHALAPALCAVPKKFGKAFRYCFVNTPAGQAYCNFSQKHHLSGASAPAIYKANSNS